MLVIRYLILAAVGTWCVGTAIADDFAKDFRDPPMAYRSMPFWHMNGKMTPLEIEAQLRDSRDKSGFGGVAVLPVDNTEPTYLSEDYFARYGEILATARNLGMEVIFYDDTGVPTGTAGGRVASLYPNDTMKRLDKFEEEVRGPASYVKPLPPCTLMSAVAMNTKTLQRVDVTSSVADGKLAWQVPSGTWKIMVFTCIRSGDLLVDIFCPESVDKFISLVYDNYYARFKQHFGTTIRRNFYDDIGLWDRTRAWTTAFNAKFQKKYGFSPTPYYPALFHDIGPETQAARAALFGFRAELLAEGYPARVGKWCRAHGIQSSGHPPGNYEPCPVDMSCDIFKFYRHSDIPLMDALYNHGYGRAGFKLISSAAAQYDRPLVAAEACGAIEEKNLNPTTLYRITMELFARGVNRIIPHGMWYDPKNVTIPPLISHFSDKMRPALPDYNHYVARSCLMLEGGRHVAEIAILYPIASLEAWFYFDPPGEKQFFVPPEADYQSVGDMLTSSLRRDFTFIHPDSLEDQCTIVGDTLRLNNAVNWEAYKVIVIPGGKVIPLRSLKKIKEFYDGGGKVVATTCLPSKSAEFGHDADVAAAVNEMFPVVHTGPLPVPYRTNRNRHGGKTYFAANPTPKILQAILDDALPACDVQFEGNVDASGGNGMLSYLHKVKDGRDLYLFANSSDTAVNAWIRLRGKLEPRLFDPHTGEIRRIEFESVVEAGQAFTRVRLELGPVRSVFVVGKCDAD